MTLAATKRYAFGASLLLGLGASILATALIAALVGDPQQVVLAMSDAEIGGFIRLVLAQIVTVARAVVELL